MTNVPFRARCVRKTSLGKTRREITWESTTRKRKQPKKSSHVHLALTKHHTSRTLTDMSRHMTTKRLMGHRCSALNAENHFLLKGIWQDTSKFIRRKHRQVPSASTRYKNFLWKMQYAACSSFVQKTQVWRPFIKTPRLESSGNAYYVRKSYRRHRDFCNMKRSTNNLQMKSRFHALNASMRLILNTTCKTTRERCTWRRKACEFAQKANVPKIQGLS